MQSNQSTEYLFRLPPGGFKWVVIAFIGVTILAGVAVFYFGIRLLRWAEPRLRRRPR
jgi:hypothetical protein